MNMTQEQKDFINTVIIPRLIEMEDNDELDVNSLSAHNFDEFTERYNSSPEQINARKLKTMGNYFCECEDEGISLASQLDILESFDGDTWTPIGDIEGLMPWDGLEHKAIRDIWDSLPD